MAHGIEGCFAEDAHVMVNHQTIYCQYLENLLEMSIMLLLVVKCNDYVIQIAKCRGNASQNVFRQPLKRLSSYGETKLHLQELEQTKGGDDSHLMDVLKCHWNLVIHFQRFILEKKVRPSRLALKLWMRDSVVFIGCGGI